MLSDIDRQVENVSLSLSLLSPKGVQGVPAMVMELNDTFCSAGNEHTQKFGSTICSGDTQKLSPNIITNMELTKEEEKILLSQGDLDTLRGRQSGEPDATRSIAVGRESCEGTAGMVSASVFAVQAVTAEPTQVAVEELTVELDPHEMQYKVTTPQIISEKRKAFTSPEEYDVSNNTGSRRPFKTRVFESAVVDCEAEEELDVEDNGNTHSMEAANIKLPSSSPDVRVTRNMKAAAVADGSKNKADFSKLVALREKRRKEQSKIIADDEDFSDQLDTSIRFTTDINSHDRVDDVFVGSSRRQSLESVKVTRSGKVRSDNDEHIEISSASSGSISSKKPTRKRNKKSNKDTSFKNPVQKNKRKTQIRKYVSKLETEKEINYTLNEWINMDNAELGARCINYISEFDRQESLCNNINGIIAGRMKDNAAIATLITKALITKLTSTGDMYTVRNENQEFKDEISKLKQKDSAQTKEINALRGMVINLQREVRSLKEGLGPFPATVTSIPKLDKAVKTSKTPVDKKEKAVTPQLYRADKHQQMDVEPLTSYTPETHMDRNEDWPQGEDAAFWSPARSNKDIESDINRDDKTNFNPSNVYSKFKNRNRQIDIDRENSRSRSKGIKIVENIQVVSPANKLGYSNDWGTVGRRGKIKPVVQVPVQSSVENSSVIPPQNRKRSISNSASGYKLSKKLARPAVVTINNKPGGATYA